MPEPIRIASVAELPGEGEVKEFACGNKMVCVSRIGGELAAMDNVCAHLGGPLGEGVVEDRKIVCPWHGWQYDPKTGMSVQVPDMGVAVYKLRIVGEDVLVEESAI